MSRAFQPPSTTNETVDQLRNLWNKHKEAGVLTELPTSATTEQMIARLNAISKFLREITQDTQIGGK